MVTLVTFCKLQSLIKTQSKIKVMSYYNLDENTTPAPGTDHSLKTDSFEAWKAKRAAREAAAGWSRSRIKASAITEAEEIKNRKKLSR